MKKLPALLSLIPVHHNRRTAWSIGCSEHHRLDGEFTSKTKAAKEAADHGRVKHLGHALLVER